MDLSTTYLGLRLPHPLMPGASPLADDLDTVRRLEDAGAAAIVMRSLFEEQIEIEQLASVERLDSHHEAFAEGLSYLPDPASFALGPERYLEQLYRIKSAVSIPLIGSLNGTSEGGWLELAGQMVQAGADALELNVYDLAASLAENPRNVEARTLGLVRAVAKAVHVPFAVKLSPFYSALGHLAMELDRAGAGGLVLFNRFYQPDIDVEQLEVVRSLPQSDSGELRLRLRWLAILSGRVEASLAVSGGVHTAVDAIKAVMAGAHAVQMVSVLLQRGPHHLTRVRQEMERWLEQHEYDSLEQMRGSMSHRRCSDPRAYERANYMQILQTWGRGISPGARFLD